MRTRARLVLALTLALVGTAAAQNSGTLSGVILDPTKAPIPQVRVKLVSQAYKQAFETTSDAAGEFEFSGLAFGKYILKVEAPGFETTTLPVQVDSAPSAALRVRLKIAAESEEVTVSATSPDAVAADQNADLVQIKQKLYFELPVRDGDALAVISVFSNPASLGAGGISIVVDGVEDSNLDIPVSTIKKVYINKNPYSAEFARPGTGRVEVITEKGSQHHFHRRVFFSLHNSALNASNAFSKVKPPLQRESIEGEFDGRLPGTKATFLVGAEFSAKNDGSVVKAQTPDGALVENVTARERKPRLLARVDYQLNPIHTLTVRYKFKDVSARNQGVGGFNLPERGTNFSESEHQTRIADNALFSSNFLNELRFSIQNRHKDTRSLTDRLAIIVLDAFSGGGAQISQDQREISLDFQDVASLITGKHSLRFGGGVRPRFFDVSDASNFGGTFRFSSLSDFNNNRPFLFTVSQGNPDIAFTQQEFFYFLQDEIHLHPTVSLSLGLRHELQTNLGDHNNLAPRIALAYAPGGGRTVFRAGGGIFYERQPAIMQQQRLLLDGLRIREAVFSNPSFPVLPGGSGLATFPTPSVVRIAPDMRTPYLVQTGLGFERRFGKRNNSLAVEYTELRGVKLYRTRNINAPLPGTGVRPDPRFLNINQFESTASSRSHNLTVTLQANVSGRFEFLSQYTLSRSMDDSSGMFSLPADNFDLRDERGRSDFDRRHRFNFAGTFRLPLGFRMGTIASFASGLPFNIKTGRDDNGDTVANDRPPGVGRNTGEGPGFANVDVRLSKKFRMGKDKNSSEYLEFRLDAFNVFNHVNFKNFVGTLSSPFFGRANSAYPARDLQLSFNLKL